MEEEEEGWELLERKGKSERKTEILFVISLSCYQLQSLSQKQLI